MALIQDFQHLAANRIVTKVLPGFKKFDDLTKILKADLKKYQVLSDKAKHAQDDAEKTRLSNGEASAVYQQKIDLYRQFVLETSQQAQMLRLHGKEFEEAKLKNLQIILENFVYSEMMLHCRSIEMYSAAARCLQKWDTESDLDEFSTVLTEVYVKSVGTFPTTQEGNMNIPATSKAENVLGLRSSISQPALSGNEASKQNANETITGMFRAQSTAANIGDVARPQARPRTTNRSVPMEDSESE